MSLADAINIGTSIVLSLGGAGVLIIGFSTWLGKVWAARVLEQDRMKYKKELEATKAQYEKQLEAYKQELDKSKALFIRYSESQFKLYNDLWGSLCKLRITVDDLWNQANIENLRALAYHLNKTTNAIESHRLLIEDGDYEKLKKVLSTLNEFKIGKVTLIRLKQMTETQIKSFNADTDAINKIETYIRQNKTSKDQFNSILETIVKDFKTRIRTIA